MPIVQPNEGIRGVPTGTGVNMLMQFEGYMNSTVYGAAFKNVVDKYMGHPNYYRVPTRLANGTVADCAYFVGSTAQPQHTVTAHSHSTQS